MIRVCLVLAVFGLWMLTACESDVGNTPSVPSPPQPSLFDWTLQTSNTTINFNDVFFIGNNIGLVVGEDAVILSTVNGGTEWPPVPVNTTEENFHAVFLINEQKSWIASSLSDDQTGGKVLISVNGGAYPEVQKTVDSPLNTVFFVDENNGWVAGNNGLVLHTTDGGAQWDTGDMGADIDIFDLHFLDENNGWAATDSGGIYRTVDGAVWQSEDMGLTSALRAIHFLDTLHGWACGSRNTILRRTQEPGQAPTWASTTIDLEAANTVWTDIFFTDTQTGWVVGEDGNIYKSTDGGATWTPETTATRTGLNAIYMVNSTKGWIVGEEGVILTYTP